VPLDPLDEVTPKDLGAVLEQTLDRMARRARGEERPVPLPWPNVSHALGGGFWGGTSVALLGDSGSGKTQFALQASLYAAESGVPICYVALQAAEDQIAARLLALRAGRNWAELYTGRDGRADIEELRRTHAQAIRALPIHIVGGSAGRWSYHNLRAVSAWMRARYPEETPGGRPFLVVVDIVQLVSGADRDTDLREVIERTAHEARLVARDLGGVVMLISSTAREGDPRLQGDMMDERIGFKRDRRRNPILGRGNPAKVARGKDPGDLEQRCDTVLVLALEPGHPQKSWTPAWCAVAKNRAGSRAWCALRFDGCRFEAAEDVPRTEPPEAAAEESAEEVVSEE
jgi:replicative DNA helicase